MPGQVSSLPTALATPCREPWGSEDSKGQAQPLPPGPGISRCLLNAGPQPHRRLVGGEGVGRDPAGPHRAPGSGTQLS